MLISFISNFTYWSDQSIERIGSYKKPFFICKCILLLTNKAAKLILTLVLHYKTKAKKMRALISFQLSYDTKAPFKFLGTFK